MLALSFDLSSKDLHPLRISNSVHNYVAKMSFFFREMLIWDRVYTCALFANITKWTGNRCMVKGKKFAGLGFMTEKPW